MAAQDAPGAGGLSPQEENRRLKRAVEELSILNDLARAIGASVNLQDIMRTIIHRSIRAIRAEQGVITLVDHRAQDVMKTLVRTMASSSQSPQYHFSQSLLGWMHLNKKPLMLNDPRTDERFRGVQWDESIRSLLCVPMMVKSTLIGVLTVYNKREEGAFTDEDQRLLAIIAGQSAQIVENARLYEEEQALQRMKEEVRLAATIQMDLLPKAPPDVPGYDIAGVSIPAQLVGGDAFDFIPIDATHIAVTLADVSGKGLPASLLMANVQATLRGQTLGGPGASVCVQRANKLLFQSTSPDKFVTLFYSVLDAGAHTLTYCNAGHDHPFHFSGPGSPKRLETGGLVVSIVEDFPYQEDTVSLAPGDVVVVYSDGITEAVDPLAAQFGDVNIESVVVASRTLGAAGIIDAIVGAVRHHADTAAQADDMTIVVIKRL
ncbi:MAG TPA: GAF domain-containing SpoIIE family protein phosphatase [Bacteroidota bacterium]|nr:GAF domain-containing SpoIIE family protein phosphatase [Bacteroidota bacterium]